MEKYTIKTLPVFVKTNEALYSERETGTTHLPFKTELELCNAIKNGDADTLNKVIKDALSREMVVGKLSTNQIMSVKYWAVTVVATAVHYAILGGLDETEAYNLSDEYIRAIDSFDSYDQCIDYLMEKSLLLCEKVSEWGNNAGCSEPVRRCLHYIHIHLHERITDEDLSEFTGISRTYLCVLFKKETGRSIHEYVTKEKLREAIDLLKAGKTCNEISYVLGFCSQSHFIEVFKKTYGITPREYISGKRSGCEL